jgi:hypothetical protein
MSDFELLCVALGMLPEETVCFYFDGSYWLGPKEEWVRLGMPHAEHSVQIGIQGMDEERAIRYSLAESQRRIPSRDATLLREQAALLLARADRLCPDRPLPGVWAYCTAPDLALEKHVPGGRILGEVLPLGGTSTKKWKVVIDGEALYENGEIRSFDHRSEAFRALYDYVASL